MIKNFLIVVFISFVVSSCKQEIKNPLDGKWIIKKVQIGKFELPDNCNNIKVGDKFIFEGKKIIIQKEVETCSKYSYTSRNNSIELFISDMSFTMKIRTVDEDKLEILCKYLPKEMMINWKEDYLKYKKEGFLITLEKE